MTVTEESFTSLTAYWHEDKYNLNWSSVFVLPAWLQVWWRIFGDGAHLSLLAVRQDGEIIGIAPLSIKGETATFVGSGDVCDYLDFIVTPGRERDFFHALLDDLAGKGIRQLDLAPLRPDSTVLTHLLPIARERRYQVQCHEAGVSVEMNLPATWNEYLASLSTKQRHEVKRKLRRWGEAGDVAYHCIEVGQEVGDLTNTFLKLFALSRKDKANFMTRQMESFFRALAAAMTAAGVLRFGILRLDELPVAMIMSFDYNDTVYLYNSAFDPRFSSLSAGLLSKVLCIKESIQWGRKKWDFLQGRETYKYHLGGTDVPLSSCRIEIN